MNIWRYNFWEYFGRAEIRAKNAGPAMLYIPRDDDHNLKIVDVIQFTHKLAASNMEMLRSIKRTQVIQKILNKLHLRDCNEPIRAHQPA